VTDGERMQHLTELARKVWPGRGMQVVHAEYIGDLPGFEVLGDERDDEPVPLCVAAHPRALDALEAALCVLAQEPLPEFEDKLNRLRHDLELLTAQWERDAGTPHCDDAGDAYVQCAEDLRKRVKEEQ
jgi:hypothetical protein